MKNARHADGINCVVENVEGTETIIKTASVEIITVLPMSASLNMRGRN